MFSSNKQRLGVIVVAAVCALAVMAQVAFAVEYKALTEPAETEFKAMLPLALGVIGLIVGVTLGVRKLRSWLARG